MILGRYKKKLPCKIVPFLVHINVLSPFKSWSPSRYWSHLSCFWTHALLVTSVGEDDQSFTKCRHCSPDRETCCNCAKISDIFAKLIKNDHPGDPGTFLGQHFCKLHSLTPTVVDATAPDPTNPFPLPPPGGRWWGSRNQKKPFPFLPELKVPPPAEAGESPSFLSKISAGSWRGLL